VCQRTSVRLQPPRALAPVFAHCRFVLKKAISAKKNGSPTGSRPRSAVYSFCCFRPPRGGGSRSGISPVLGRSSPLAFMRRLGILSRGVVAPVLLRVISPCMRSRQPTSCIAPAIFAYGIPVYMTIFIFLIFFPPNPHPPVVVAFGHTLPFCNVPV
jgi:hypothetical protein